MIRSSLIIMAVFVGCEGRESVMSSDLEPMRDEAIAYVNFSFHTDYKQKPPVKWGEKSRYWSNGIIEINESLKGDDGAVLSHMRHEVFHAITGMADYSGSHFNGVEIASKVPWWPKE